MNNHDTSASSATTAPTANLRIITLAHGSNRENDVMLTVPLDVTVGELKDRLKWLVAGFPSAEQQRLIYHGRPLLEGSASLRSVLRFQAADPNQTTHVLHLVIRTDATTIPTASQTTPTTASPTVRSPHAQNPQERHPPHMPQMPNLFQNMLDPTQLAEQANIFQQHMAIHNQHLANLQPGMPHVNHGNMQHMHGGSPGAEQFRGATAAGEHPFAAHSPAMGGQHHMSGQGMTVRVQETTGPNGERIRVVTNSSSPAINRQLNHALHSTPIERSASAPGTADRAGSPGLPQMHRTHHHPQITSNTNPFTPRTFYPPRPMLNPAFQAGIPTTSSNPTVWLLSSPTGPQALLFVPGHGFFSTAPGSHPTAQAMSANLGSHAHTSSRQQTPVQTNPVQRPQDPGQARANNVADPQARAEMILRQQEQAQPPVAANVPAQIQNRDRGDMAAFIIQRGWLFLRLYIFIFVLSEPGTWRRIILLGLATLICFLPRQNPLTDAFNVARQHFDNLIGPAEPPPVRPDQGGRPRAQDGANGNVPQHNAANTGPNGATAGRNAMPTPEEHANRLLRERQDRNPSFIRELLRPVEQAVALFLASLIPGVGERHVRAREEARRIIAEEEQRRRTEEEERANQRALGDGEATAEVPIQSQHEEKKFEVPQTLPSQSDPTEPEMASSTGVESAAASAEGSNATSGEGLHRRAGEHQEPPPHFLADW